MVPGSAQILGISGFVNSKTDGEYTTSFVRILMSSPKKGLQPKMPQLSQDFDVIHGFPHTHSSVSYVVISDFIYFSELVCCRISRAWIFSNLVFILHQIFPCSNFTVIEADLVSFHTEGSITSSSASWALFQLCSL